MEIEKVGGKLYVTETYTLIEIGGGVVSKGQALRYFESKHPEYKAGIITHFKVDPHNLSVEIVVQVKEKSCPITFTGANGSKIEGEKSSSGVCGNRKDHATVGYIGQDQKLLNPGYDELEHDLAVYKEKYDELRAGHDNLIEQYDEIASQVEGLKKQLELGAEVYDELLKEVWTLRLKATGREKLSKELDDIRLELSCSETVGMDNRPLYEWAAAIVCGKLQLQEKYDALVKAVGIEKLVAKDDRLAKLQLEELNNIISGPYSESAPTAEEVAACAVDAIKAMAEDASDLSEAKDVLAKDDMVDMPEDEGDVKATGDPESGVITIGNKALGPKIGVTVIGTKALDEGESGKAK